MQDLLVDAMYDGGVPEIAEVIVPQWRHYRFLLESREGLQQVNVDCTESVVTAIGKVREHFDFEQWRIVNIAEKPQEG